MLTDLDKGVVHARETYAKGGFMRELRDKHLTVIGVGNIGRILLTRLRAAGVPADHLTVCDADPERRSAAAAEFGVRAADLTDEAACTADVLLIATPPKAVAEVLRELAGWLRPGQVVVSFAGLAPLARLEALLPAGVSVVRVMPSTPSLIGQGMNPVAYGSSVTPEARTLVKALLTTLGDTIVVRDDQMNWCVGLAGAAMRSVLPVLEGMTQAGVDAGLPEPDARRVAGQIVLGTAVLVLQTSLSFDKLKALTPVETVDEPAVAQLFREAAHTVKEKMDRAQAKLWTDHAGN
ncbi:MAG: prephenate dehydrogenase/arogenate dehydrogenase family protein [Chloroflexi bacterium]|nr:MAG: prephenate dehydrogenase/arogenate dehydrogenase family protein [Chloroflexota bacterium]